MTWWLVIMLIAGFYVAGWFTTALAITQVGTVKRGCVPECTLRRKTDRWGDAIGWEGSHAVGCNKPHFQLVTATDAATYALAWPYLWFYGVLAVSEKKAHDRVEGKAAKQAKKQLTPEQLKNLDKILENPNIVINDDGSIRVIKELET